MAKHGHLITTLVYHLTYYLPLPTQNQLQAQEFKYLISHERRNA